MILLRGLEILIIGIVLLLIYTQIAIPIIRRTKFFPLLREENLLEKKLVEQRQKKLEEKLKREINKNAKSKT